MIITTTVDLSPHVYRYLMEEARNTPDLSTEELMSLVLTLFISMRQSNLNLTQKEWNKFDRLLREGLLKHLL